MKWDRSDIHVLPSALEGVPIDPRWLLALATGVGLFLAFGVVAKLLWGRRATEPEWLQKVTPVPRWVAASSRRTVIAVFLVAFVSGMANGVLRYPVPSVNDEFGAILTAETLAEGRMANPQHPLWRHFETVGVSHAPVYIGKYPPGTAIFLALGQRVLGHPWWGQLIAYALAAAAVAWMLRAWVGPRWGLVGGMLAALHPNLQHFQVYDYGWANYSWSHSYWGGAVAMLGGALLFGGLRHFLRRPRASNGALLALGLALLANARPMEGFLVSLPVAGVLLHRVATGRLAIDVFAKRLVAPALLVLVPTAIFIAQYNAATTGDPLSFVHQHYASQYGVAAELLFQEPKTPPAEYGNAQMERFYLEWVRPTFLSRANDLEAYVDSRLTGLEKFAWLFFSTCWPALLAIPLLWREAWWRFALAIVALSLALMLVVFDFHPHYASPTAPILFALVAGGLAALMRVQHGTSMIGRLVVVVVLMLSLGVRLAELPVGQSFEHAAIHDWPRLRAFVLARLREDPARDLVVVSTHPGHLMFQNWLHNGADLESGEIVFARDLGIPLEENPIVSYYPDRKVWHLDLRAEAWTFRRVPRGTEVAGS